MFRKSGQMRKMWRRYRLLAVCALLAGAGLLLIGLPSAATPNASEANRMVTPTASGSAAQVAGASTPTVPAAQPGTAAPDGPQAAGSNPSVIAKSSARPSAAAKPSASSQPSLDAGTSAPAAPTKPAAAVTLTVNGNSKGQVAIRDAMNQCDVLSAALAAGKISSLVMRMNDTYKTQAVYVIDGIGSETKVGWVFLVNGVSPPKGCSNVPARAGDAVVWKYVQ